MEMFAEEETVCWTLAQPSYFDHSNQSQKSFLEIAKRPGATMNQIIGASILRARRLRKNRWQQPQVQTPGPVRAFKYNRDGPSLYWVMGALESCCACILDECMCVVSADWYPGQLCTPWELTKTACTLSRRTQGGTKSRPQLFHQRHVSITARTTGPTVIPSAPERSRMGEGPAVAPEQASSASSPTEQQQPV